MNARDHKYLLLQFQNKIYSKNATEFQTFFEDIMDKVYPDFKRVPSWGGDGGNDGWIKSLGRYYQVYAPVVPAIKETKAAKKFKEDFKTLQENWDHITEIKEYYLVFNDKQLGSKKTEETAAELEEDNPTIKFEVFLSKNLEKEFFSLSEADILALGFDVDARKSIEIVRDLLQKAEVELDSENVGAATSILLSCKDVVSDLDDLGLVLDFELLECQCLLKRESIEEAKKRYKNLSKRYPDDPRPILYLAERYLTEKRFEKNRTLLDKAKELDSQHWLLELQELLRKIHKREKVDVESIDEGKFPHDPKKKSNFYRLYSICYESALDQVHADSFIEKAIHVYPEQFANHVTKHSLILNRLLLEEDQSIAAQKAEEFLKEIEKLEQGFGEEQPPRPRIKVQLNENKLLIYRFLENFREIEKGSTETFELILECYFDSHIDELLTNLLAYPSLSKAALKTIQEYLKATKLDLSNNLLSAIFAQFSLNNILFSEGYNFFSEIGNEEYLKLIRDIKDEKHDDVLAFLKEDIILAAGLASILEGFFPLREKIIESLSDNEIIDSQKMLLNLRYEEGKFDDVFEILKTIDLERLNAPECRHVLKIIQGKNAWDIELIVRENLLEREKDKKDAFGNKLNLLMVYFNLRKHLDVIALGEELLAFDAVEKILPPKDKETLLNLTISSCVSRAKIDPSVCGKLHEILETHRPLEPSFEYKIGVEAEAYLVNEQPEKALEAIVEGVRIKKILSADEYAKLYFFLAIRLGNRKKIDLASLKTIEKGCFVKIKTTEIDGEGESARDIKSQWYYLGEENELDAIKVDSGNEKYQRYINKKLGDKVVFENRYGPNRQNVIETIFSIEQYILWRTLENFRTLTESNDLEGVKMIEVPQKEGTVDIENLKKFFEDLRESTEPFFEIYCKGNNLPLAMLAVNEGSFTNAIGRIQTTEQGYINSSTGTLEEFQAQKKLAAEIIDNQLVFYLDGTSALFLSEFGIFQIIYSQLPGLKVPQSVIGLLESVAERFRHSAGHKGVLQYIGGNVSITTIEKQKSNLIRSNLVESIRLLESDPENVSVISSANKQDCMAERLVPAELCDACILAQQKDLPLLTEDFIYTKFNELETKKKAPKYFSSLALLRVLYEKGTIDFEDYHNFFGYLSSYRFKFLSFDLNDLEKAVFGDGRIVDFDPQNIRNFNFRLTLTEEYGVDFRQAFSLVGGFLLTQLTDSTVTPDMVEKIFVEIVETFPTKVSKRQFAEMLLKACSNEIKKSKNGLVVLPDKLMVDEKVKHLSGLSKVFV